MVAQRFTIAIALAAISLAAVPLAPLHAQALTPKLPSSSPYVVEVLAEDYAFDAPDVIPSGWVTLRMQNVGEEHHFAFLSRLPEGRTFDEYMVDVAGGLNKVWYAIRSGEVDRAEVGRMMGRNVPEWYWSSAERMGGVGILLPGGTSQVTLNLKPGSYVMVCYMQTPEGEFHFAEGMVRPLTVMAESSGALPPVADVAMTLSNDGIAAPDELTPGRHTVAVHFAEHTERGAQHDVHLARLGEGMDVVEIVPWMNWMDVWGLRNPAPATFVGGTHEMPAGYTAYVTVDLEPGRYAWISQLTAPLGMFKEFTVR